MSNSWSPAAAEKLGFLQQNASQETLVENLLDDDWVFHSLLFYARIRGLRIFLSLGNVCFLFICTFSNQVLNNC
jgi:hypothetical protein